MTLCVQIFRCQVKLKLFILITLVDFAELLTDFSYTNFTVGQSNVDALDRLRVEHYIVMLAFKVFFRNKIMFMRTRSLSNASLCKVAYNNDSNQPFPGINEQL